MNAHLPLLEFSDRAQLRAWLQTNGSTSQGIRLAVGKRGNSSTTLTYNDAIEEALAFGWIDSKAQRLDEDRYAITYTPRRPGSGWARTNKSRVERLIREGLMAPAGLGVVEAAKADGSWSALDEAEDLVVPADLASALAENPAAETFWNGLGDSARKIALYRIASAKRPETRARRIAEIVAESADGQPRMQR